MRNKTKHILLFSFYISILSVCFIDNLAIAHTLKTPNETTVSHSHPYDTGWSGHTQQYWTEYSDSYYSGLYDARIARANRAYNCHAYAWASARQSNSSLWCWIDTPQDNKYWNDGSYIETSLSQASRVSYGDSKDHSLLKYSGSTMTSKWGKFPAYRHQLYSDPYDASSSDAKFYRTSPPLSVYISGPSGAPCATGTWYANVSYGKSPYNYKWYHKWVCSGGGGPKVPCDVWNAVGSNSPTLQMYLCSGNSVIKVEVTDSLGGTDTDEYYVVGSGGDGPDPKMTSQANALPVIFALSQNYPNPFNPTTRIKFALPETGKVKITMYNIQGKVISSFVNMEYPAGYHEVSFDASNLSSGFYFYKIEVNGYVSVKKLQVIK